MYSDVKQSKAFLIGLILILLIIAAVAAWSLARGSSADLTEEGAAAIKDMVQKGALQCYVVEGVYPPDLQYLQDHYGLQINTDAYYVTYDVFASNQPPVVVVTPNAKAQ